MNTYYCYYKNEKETIKYFRAYTPEQAKILFYESTLEGNFENIIVKFAW